MHGNEVAELRADILDAFKDLGTESTDFETVQNIQWLSWKNSSYDKLYNQNTNKQYESPIKMIGLCLGNAPASELLEIGLDFDHYEKLYMTSDQFIDNNITIQPGDRYIHRGIKYEVSKFKKVSLASSHDVFYTIYSKEAPIVSQSSEYQETASPNFEFDKSKETISETPTDSRTDMFVENFAKVTSTKLGLFEILGGSVYKLRVHIIDGDTDSGVTEDISITEDDYLIDDLIIELQDKFDTAFGEDVFSISKNVDGYLTITYSEFGLDKGFELQAVAAPAYYVLGIDLGMYLGEKEII